MYVYLHKYNIIYNIKATYFGVGPSQPLIHVVFQLNASKCAAMLSAHNAACSWIWGLVNPQKTTMLYVVWSEWGWIMSSLCYKWTASEFVFVTGPRPPLQQGGYFGPHPSAIGTFTHPQKNRMKGGNRLRFVYTKLNKALTVYLSVLANVKLQMGVQAKLILTEFQWELMSHSWRISTSWTKRMDIHLV